MGSVRVVEYSTVGEHSTSLEYEFSEAKDFFEYQERQQASIRQTFANLISVEVSDALPDDFEGIIQAAMKKKENVH